MSKSSIACKSCGHENEPDAVFCIECGANLATSRSNETGYQGASKQTHSKSYQFDPEVSETHPDYRSGRRRMRNTRRKPMFLRMPMMFIVIAVFIIFIIFFNGAEFPM